MLHDCGHVTPLLIIMPFPSLLVSICDVAQVINPWVMASLSWLRYSGSISQGKLPCKWFIKGVLTGDHRKETGEPGQGGEDTQQEWDIRQSSHRISLKKTWDCDWSLGVVWILGRELGLSHSWNDLLLVKDLLSSTYIPGSELAISGSQMGSSSKSPQNHRYWQLEAEVNQKGVRWCS